MDCVLFIIAGIGAYIGAYAKEKGKNQASKEDFYDLKEQLDQNTQLVEKIKSQISERGWIDQQTWLVKRESYDAIFELMFNIKTYVDRETEEYDEWYYHEYLCHDELSYVQGANEGFDRQANSSLAKEETKELKKRHDAAIENLLRLIDVKAIYIDGQVVAIISKLRIELSVVNDDDDFWGEHLKRLKSSILKAIDEIREVGKEELKIGFS